MTEQYSPTENSPQHLGVAGKMAQAFIHSPLSPLIFFAMLFMGIMGLIFTPRQEDPQISVPMIDIFIQYPGASAQQVAKMAIDPLERIMSEIPGVKHVYSAAERGQGLVTVRFDVGEDLGISIVKVHDKLQSNLDKMPPGVLPPLVKPKGIDDVPVVTLTLWSEDVDDGALRTLAFEVMQQLKGIPNTGQSFVVGGRAEQVLIELKPERLSGFGISLGQVAQTIQTANSEYNAGYVETNNTHYTVYTGKFLSNAYEIGQLVVGTYQNAPIYVRDVANVSQGPEKEPNQIVNYFSGPAYGYKQKQLDPQLILPIANGAPAVTIAIAKKIGTNGVTVANAILERIETLKKTVIPDNVQVEVTRNYGETANDKVNDLIKKLFIATGAVTILVLWWLGWRPALVVTIVIPVVILITVFSAWILGFTIDRVSLFALIFSIGILVDDAIVVIENIYRRWLLKGETDTSTAVDAVREVGNPTILATFTVVAALLPMGFVSGMMGPYMLPIPILGSVAMVFSLFAAFVFTPWLAMHFKPSLAALQKAEHQEHKSNERWERRYRKVLPPLFTNRLLGWGFLLLLIVSFAAACSMFYFKSVEVKMLPLDKKPEFNVFIDMPEGTALPVTANLTYQLANRLRQEPDFPEVIALQTYVGTSQPFDFNGMVRHYYLRNRAWHADIHVQLQKHKCHFPFIPCLFEKHHRSSHEIAVQARRTLNDFIKGELKSPAKITIVEMPPGPPVLQAMVAEVYGPDDKTRWEVAQKITQAFQKAEIVKDVDNYMIEPYEFWRFEVDTEKAVRRGISVDTINQNLMMALGGFKLGDIKEGHHLEPTYIIIQVPLMYRAQLSRLYDLPIPSQNGGIVPLTELGHFVKDKQEPIYYQKDLRPVEYVVGDSVGIYDEVKNSYSLSAPIYGMLEVESLLKDYETPDGINLIKTGCHSFSFLAYCDRFIGPPPIGKSGFEWSGEWTVTYETFRDMGLAFCVAMVLIYILVVWLFGNFIVPAIIMVPIPLTLLGIIPGHWFLDAEFTATSMIGWIALAGIIVRNSILLVDYSIHEIQKGTPIQDAVILACKTRTRPILITALALVAGSSVIIVDPIFQGMAISLLSGVLVSTLLTLIVIPLGCLSIGPNALCATAGNGHGDLPPPTAAHFATYQPATSQPPAMPLWLRLWIVVISVILWIINAVKMVYYLIRAIFIIIFSIISSVLDGLIRKNPPPTPSPTTPTKTPPTSPPPPVMTPSQTTGRAELGVTSSLSSAMAAEPSTTRVTLSPEAAVNSMTLVVVDTPSRELTTLASATVNPQISTTEKEIIVSAQLVTTPVQSASTDEINRDQPIEKPTPLSLETTLSSEVTPSEEEELTDNQADQDPTLVITTSETTSRQETPPTAAAKQTTSRASKKKATTRRGIQLKTDLVTQYKPEKSDNGNDDSNKSD
ncbi:acriflavin resistance protein [Thioploca ingrica]|uniref:Acriflavin resistance protein n=1 Tax=Thioploca ingrica TaxID=40754 RepID=A0A090AE54_9GAMM|nr:acriflavin resistance protein [Thioploca ingrica]